MREELNEETRRSADETQAHQRLLARLLAEQREDHKMKLSKLVTAYMTVFADAMGKEDEVSIASSSRSDRGAP